MTRSPLLPGGAMSAGGDLDALFKRANEAFRAGNLSQAAWSCRLILAANKDHFEALHLLAMVEFQQGRCEEARGLLRKALRINNRSAAAHVNFALILNTLDEPEAALRSLDAALKIRPDDPLALSNRGNVLLRLGRTDEALASLDRAIEIAPTYSDALINRGNILVSLKRYEEALSTFDRALAADPRDAIAWHNRGNVLWQLKRADEALASFERSLTLKPDDVLVLLDFGRALMDLSRPAEALAKYDRVLEISPEQPDALTNRGHALWRLKHPDKALASYDKLLAIKPQDAEVLMGRGNALGELGRFDEALNSLDRSMELVPDSRDVHWNRAWLLLRFGHFEQGWKEHEWRPATAQFRQFSQPRWHGGEPLAGKTILLYSEQGFGDTIQFARFATLLAERGGKVILQVQQPLKNLLAQLEGVECVIGEQDDPPAFDCHCPLLSLPFELQINLEALLGNKPYLSVPSDRVRQWDAHLPPTGGRRIGIAWAGRPTFADDAHRSIGLAALSSLLSLPGIEFVSLQKELRPGDDEILKQNPQVVHLGDEIQDFCDTAAIMSRMDLIISSDTSVVHLAGAMGIPTWILLSRVADWRWLIDREDCPWYSSVRLFRQSHIGDWKSVIDRVAGALRR